MVTPNNFRCGAPGQHPSHFVVFEGIPRICNGNPPHRLTGCSLVFQSPKLHDGENTNHVCIMHTPSYKGAKFYHNCSCGAELGDDGERTVEPIASCEFAWETDTGRPTAGGGWCTDHECANANPSHTGLHACKWCGLTYVRSIPVAADTRYVAKGVIQYDDGSKEAREEWLTVISILQGIRDDICDAFDRLERALRDTTTMGRIGTEDSSPSGSNEGAGSVADDEHSHAEPHEGTYAGTPPFAPTDVPGYRHADNID